MNRWLTHALIAGLGLFVANCTPGSTLTLTTPTSTTSPPVGPTATRSLPTASPSRPQPTPSAIPATLGPTSSSEALYEVVFTIPIGEAGVTYSVGEPRWGPQALALGPDGTFWIADTAADPDRIVHYSADGTRLDEVNLDGVSLGTSDLEVTEKEMILLSLATVPPKVVRTTLEGQLLASYDLPPGYRLEDGLTGIALGGEGEILVERMAGAYVAELAETKGELALTERPGYPFHGVMYAGDPIDPMVEETKQGVVSAGETTVEVQVEHDLAGLRILGVNADGSFYVLVDEMRIRRETYDFETDLVGDLRVDETIRLYDAAGKPMGATRAPRDLRYAEVAHELALGPDGAVYMMLTKADHVAILRLKLVDELKSIFSAEPEP